MSTDYPIEALLLGGLFTIEDRGDGIAEIKLNGDFGEITAEDVAAWAELDGYLGRPEIPVPVGLKVTSMIVGFIHGDDDRILAAQDDQTGEWIRTESALPGYAHMTGAAARVRVESMHDLDRYLRNNRDLALRHWLESARP